jgi:hypothetical protein
MVLAAASPLPGHLATDLDFRNRPSPPFSGFLFTVEVVRRTIAGENSARRSLDDHRKIALAKRLWPADTAAS